MTNQVKFRYNGFTDTARLVNDNPHHQNDVLLIKSVHWDNLFYNLSGVLGTNSLTVQQGAGPIIPLTLQVVNDRRLIDAVTYTNEINSLLIAAYGVNSPIFKQLSTNSFEINNPDAVNTYVFSATNVNSLKFFHSNSTDLTLLPSSTQTFTVDVYLGVNSIILQSDIGVLMTLPQASITATSTNFYLPIPEPYITRTSSLSLDAFYSTLNKTVSLEAKDKVIILTLMKSIV